MTSQPRGVSAELARYVQREYGANASYARTMIGQAKRVRSIRSRNGTDGLVRRLIAAVAEAFAAVWTNPGGA